MRTALADVAGLYDAVKQKHRRNDVVLTNAGSGDLAPLHAIAEEAVRA